MGSKDQQSFYSTLSRLYDDLTLLLAKRLPMTYPPKPAFTPSISFGNIVTLVTIVVTAGIAWGQIKAEIASEKSLRSISETHVAQAVASTVDSNTKMEQRVRDLEQQQARIDERFTMVITLLTELKSEISRINEAEKTK